MAAVWDKVVRVENMTPTGGAVHFDEDNVFQIDDPRRCKDNALSRQKLGELYEDDIQLGQSAVEGGDVLFSLPEGWPNIAQLFVRRSWDLTTATSPAVNKAVSHLEILQNTLEDWAKDVEMGILSRVSSRINNLALSSTSTLTLAPLEMQTVALSMGPGSMVSCRQLRFIAPSVMTSERNTTSRSTETSRVMPARLSIEGVGLKPDEDEGSMRSEVTEEVAFDVPYLGAEEVIDEVTTLLARLENDRRGTRIRLQKERDRIGMLQGRIDNLAMRRLAEFAESVQREHEACSMDINELNWHVSYRSRIETRIKNKVAIAEVLNSRLKEDIEFVKKHCPLVQEKLELEREAMERIKQAQHDTNDELSVTVDRCAKVETKSEEAYTKADAERNHLQLEVEHVRIELRNISQELSEVKMLFNSYIHQCNDFRQQLDDNQQELMVLEVKHENAKTAEEMQHAKIRGLQSKIVEQEFEHRKYVDMNNRYQATLDIQRRSNQKGEDDRVTAIKQKDAYLRKLTLTNDELGMDIEDAITNISKCDKQRIADDKNLVRMEREQVRMHDQMKVAEDDLTKVRAINNAIREKLEREEECCATAEESIKTTCEQLRKQIKDEIHSRTVIMARISAENTDLIKSQVDAKQKKEKVSKKATEVEAQVKNVLTKVVRLRSTQNEHEKVITALQKEMEETKASREKLETGHDEARDTVLPEHEKSTADLDTIKKQLGHMDWKTQMMKKNMDDMSASFSMMSRSMATTQKAINRLQDEYDDLRIEITGSQHLDEQIRIGVKEMTKRIQDSGAHHKDMLKDRNTAFQQRKIDLVENLKLNKELASQYRRLQNSYLKVKNDLLNRYEERLKLETGIKDLRQIQSLQKRMHSALLEYYKLRGMYNTSELGRMESESSQNGLKVADLKFDLDDALNSIGHFLNSQMDGTTARRAAMEKVVLEETGHQIELAVSRQGTLTVIRDSLVTSDVPPEGFLLMDGTPIVKVANTPVAAIAI